MRTWIALITTALSLAMLPGPMAAAGNEPKLLTKARTALFTSLDPQRQFDQESYELTGLLYNTLLAYAYLERPYKLVPELLVRMPELSADQLTYTLTLKKGVMFHDNRCFVSGKGRELTADDVLYTIKRYADPLVNHKSWSAMEGAVVGLDDYRKAAAAAGKSPDHGTVEVAGLKKIDRHTLTIKLTRPNPLFLYALAISSTAIVPPEAVRTYGDRFDVNPVGSGPYMLAGPAERKGVLRFIKHPGYHGTYPATGSAADRERGLLNDAGRKLPFIDVIEMPLIEEQQPAALRFLKGELDWHAIDRANFTRMIERGGDGSHRLKPEFASKFDLYAALRLHLVYIAFNLKDPVLGGNKKLRQALAHLVDSQGLIDTLLNGRGARLGSVVPLDLRGSERDTGAAPLGYDLAAARRLLAEAGFPDGRGLEPLTLSYSDTSSATRDVFDFHKARFAAAGVRLLPDLTDNPTFVKNVEGGKFKLAGYGWFADYPDAENFYQLLYSKNVAPGPNLSSFANPAYDHAYEASRLMADGPERLRHLRAMNDILREEMPMVVLLNSTAYGLTQKWVRNFKRNLLTNELPYLDIDMARKKQRP